MKHSDPHDIGGLEGGPVVRGEHDTAWWEWQVDAMVRLALKKGLISDFAELRDGIERLTPAEYQNLTYYERWSRSLAFALVDKGVVTEEALQQKIAEIAARQETQP